MYIGLDIGTSSVKGVLAADTGEIVKTAHESFEYRFLENGGVEIDAEKYISACFAAIRVLSEGQEKIDGFCASSASGNLLVLGRDMKPQTPIYNWQDTRVTTEAREILGEMDLDKFYRQTGWPFSYKGLPLALLCYLKKHTPEILQNCGMVCMSTEYLYYRLTGEWGISTSAATPFYLVDQKKKAYIPEILDKIGIDESKVPPVMPCGAEVGKSTEEAEKSCGLKEGTPVMLGSFDHPSAARGVGVLKEGEMLLSCGTSWVAFMPVNDRSKIEKAGALIDPFLSEKGGPWGAMVSVASVSERIRIYIDRYIDNTENKYDALRQLAENSTSNGLSINLYDEPDDRKFKGFTKENIARAIAENAVILLKEKIKALEDAGLCAKTAVMVGGPSSNPLWPKLISETLKTDVTVKHGAFAGAMGAAEIAKRRDINA